MKKFYILIFMFALCSFGGFSQTKVVSLENDLGIISDLSGSVTLWENQVTSMVYGDAVQSNTLLGGEELQETYPGKVNVGFNKAGSFLELEGTNLAVVDNTYSVFYVGTSENAVTDKPASLVGNYDMENGFGNCSGIRFIRLQDGKIAFDYARPNFTRVTLGVNAIPENSYFFFGFTIDASGNYKYFDSTSPIITEGSITNTMTANRLDEDLKFNLFEEVPGAQTYNHTEVVEFSMYDVTLDATAFQAEYDRLAGDSADGGYAELVTAEFSVTGVLPANRIALPANAAIEIAFSQDVEVITSNYPKVYVNKSSIETAGNWVLSPSNILTFTPDINWPTGGFVSVEIQETLKSADDVAIGLAQGAKYSFIVEVDNVFNFDNTIEIEAIATVDFPIAGHKLPLKITTPVIEANTTEKFPVHIWVHGGGWSGGTQATSLAANSPHKDYLAENLGIATLSISYRTSGSSGTFSLAREDVETAYQWALDNADTYNFDMTKVFFSGGSAGAPLAALAAEEHHVLGFIGFNGIYDFVNDSGDFGTNNSYKQNVPSEAFNSPINQLTDSPTATILMHGDADTTINLRQSTNFTDAITAKGGDGTTVVYPGEVHAFFNAGRPAYEDVLIEMVGFINKRLQENSLSIGTIYEESKIIAYPNPLKEGAVLNLQLNSKINTGKVDVQIVNQLGQVVLNSSVDRDSNSNTININTEILKKGVYFLKTFDNVGSKNIKFVVK